MCTAGTRVDSERNGVSLKHAQEAPPAGFGLGLWETEPSVTVHSRNLVATWASEITGVTSDLAALKRSNVTKEEITILYCIYVL